MTEQLTLKHERVDDIPLLLAQIERMQVTTLVGQCFPTHGNWEDLSLGQVGSVWLTFILSEANPRRSHVEPWAERRLVVRSVAWVQAQQPALETRLAKAQTELTALNERRQGKQRYPGAAEVRAASRFWPSSG